MAQATTIREIIGRKPPPIVTGWGAWSVAYDTTRPDYAWWDAMRRGEKVGYELASVFTRPATNVRAAWTLGRGFRARLADEENWAGVSSVSSATRSRRL